MITISKQLVRTALLVMLFQFVCPAFISIIHQPIPTSKETTLSTQHTSIVAPLLLKEKDEKENADCVSSDVKCAPILDLAMHGSNLTAAHDNQIAEKIHEYGLVHPPRVKMSTILLI